MNGHEASPPPPLIRLRPRNHRSDRRPPDRRSSQHRHQTRLAVGARPQGRDRDQHGTSHPCRTPTRPEENPSSRPGARTDHAAAAGSAGDTPGDRSKQPGWYQRWGGVSHVASSGSARQPHRNLLDAIAAAFKAFFRIKCGVKHAERTAMASSGRQAAAVLPIPTAAAATDSSRSSRRSCATDSSGGSQRPRRTTALVPPATKAVADDNRSVRSDCTRESTRGSPHHLEATLTMEDILSATDNFSSACRIGQGGFGSVYKGVLPGGKVVAVKRAKKGSGNGSMDPEFQCEISILPHVTHLNLVRFICYVEGRGERVLVVEYVPNGTLREHLDGVYGKSLDFLARLSIAVDIAHAVTYLHGYAEHPIIHRDIKASNILLTKSLRAKVGDFSFARLGPSKGSFIVTRVKGTTGYLDPEYLKTQQLTDKSDVYAFGVLLVELLSGRRPLERRRSSVERVTADWAKQRYQCGEASKVLDPNIPKSPAANLALERMLELASQCLAPTKHGRPSMKDCGKFLMLIRKDYVEFLDHNSPQLELSER